jgi:tricorn protease-like protein/C-terminal processing protease CtpA/Prc
MDKRLTVLPVLAAQALLVSCAGSAEVGTSEPARIVAVSGQPLSARQEGNQQQASDYAGMLRFPAVSDEHIVFSYGNDLWLVSRDGGQAVPLASPPGQELFPRFSPDGRSVVFQGNYDGDRDLYTLPIGGGVPTRVTHHPSNEQPTQWHDSGILFFMSGTAGLGRQQEVFRVSPQGGLPERLPVPYGANGVLNDDGQWLAYTPIQRDARTWKRYRGGMASDIWLFNINTNESRQVTDWEGTDSLPMWHGDSLYYVSDAGDDHRLNIWRYDLASGDKTQVTNFTDNDVKFPSISEGEGGAIVFSLGTKLHLLDLAANEVSEVQVTIPGATPAVRTKTIDASGFLQAGGISSTGKRVVVEARGDIWTLPAENGPPRQLTDTSRWAERNPAWSPSGQWIAFASDESGEYNIHVVQSDGGTEPRQLTDMDGKYWMTMAWSPDSKTLLAVDKSGEMYLIDIESGEATLFDTEPYANVPSVRWSPDSRWITYAKGGDNMLTAAIHIYDTQDGTNHQVTSGYFGDGWPVFSGDGEYLFYTSNREFTSPQYETVGSSFVYANAGRLIAVPLTEEVENPRLIEVDEETWEEDEPEDSDEADDSDEETADEAAEEGEGDAAADDAADLSPIQGTWEGTATGLAALGLPMDELEVTMYFKKLEDGSFVGASESMGELSDYDSVTFDEDTGKLVTTSSEQGINSKTEATLNGDTLTGTWSISGPLEGSGPFTATRQGTEVPDGKIDGAEGGGGKGKDGKAEPVEIDFDGFEARGFMLPVSAGNFNNLLSNDGGDLLYNSFGSGAPSVKLVDLSGDEIEEKTVVAGAQMVDISGDGKKILLAGQGNQWKIADAKPGQTMSGSIQPSGLRKRVEPREEWRQLVQDAWRRHRDFFYVENMHGVDWDAVYDHYSQMVDHAASREDVGFIIGEMISELNVGHAYYWGGDVEGQPSQNVGMLGVDFEVASEQGEDGQATGFRIARMYGGAPWDTDARNPLDVLGVDVEEGDIITHVNGKPVDTSTDPWAAFVGTAGKQTTITVVDALTGDEEAINERTYTIEPIGDDQALRYRHWVEANRQYVDEASDGKIGYIHVPDTGVNGQNELFRQFYAQIDKDALIIDDRWNGGGQIPTRFIELLNRPRTNYWYRRDGKDWAWPYDSHQGPKAMLINGSAGSGGDMFPWLFKHNDLGPLVGKRTWGGLVGISGVPPLIDGGYTAVPNFGFYRTDGTWGIEGHGVDPDIEVVDDPTALASGQDPQIDAAVEYLLEAIEREGYQRPQRPAEPDRSGFGIDPGDR